VRADARACPAFFFALRSTSCAASALAKNQQITRGITAKRCLFASVKKTFSTYEIMCDKLPPAAASPAPAPTPTNQEINDLKVRRLLWRARPKRGHVIFAAESNPVALIHALRASSAKTAGPEKATALS
jgi:hypothetical protein